MNRSWVTILSLLVISELANSKVLLIGKNTFLSFDDVQATFTPTIRSSGECGLLYAAEPLNACSDLINRAENVSKIRSSYVLIIRGDCSFEKKVRNAQRAGYKAVIVYNDGYDELLPRMAGSSTGIHIHGVFVTRASGEALKEYAGRTDLELWLIPRSMTSSLSIMAISIMSLLVISPLLAFCFFLRRCQNRFVGRTRGLSRMPKNLLQSLPTEVFVSVLEQGSTSVSCAICIDDYCVGDRLKILPCQHKFHAVCIDSWLGHWRSFCPVCKRNARTENGDSLVTERTPLLSPSLYSTTSLQSVIIQEPLSCSVAPQAHTVPMHHRSLTPVHVTS